MTSEQLCIFDQSLSPMAIISRRNGILEIDYVHRSVKSNTERWLRRGFALCVSPSNFFALCVSPSNSNIVFEHIEPGDPNFLSSLKQYCEYLFKSVCFYYKRTD